MAIQSAADHPERAAGNFLKKHREEIYRRDALHPLVAPRTEPFPEQPQVQNQIRKLLKRHVAKSRRNPENADLRDDLCVAAAALDVARHTGRTVDADAEQRLAAGIAHPEPHIRTFARTAAEQHLDHPTIRRRLLAELRHQNPSRRADAAAFLARFADEPDIAHHLLKAARDPDRHVRAGAARMLDIRRRLQLQPPKTPAERRRRLADLAADDDFLQLAAAYALVPLAHEPDAQARLLDALARRHVGDDTCAERRAVIAPALVRHGDDPTLRAQIAARLTGTRREVEPWPDPDHYAALVRLLIPHLHHRDAAQRLIAELDDPENHLRHVLAAQLAEHFARHQPPPDFAAALRRRLAHQNPDVAEAAATALLPKARQPEVRQAALHAYLTQTPPGREALLALALAAADDAQERAAVLAAFKDACKHSADKWHVSHCLGPYADDEQVADLLETYIRDSFYEIAVKACEAFKNHLHLPEIQTRFRRLLDPAEQTINLNIKDHLAHLIRETGLTEHFKDLFLTALDRPEPHERRRAVSSLAQLADDPEIRRRLLALRRDPAVEVRRECLAALTSYAKEDTEIRDFLFASLAETDPILHDNAADALARLADDPEIRRRLMERCADPDGTKGGVRIKLLHALFADIADDNTKQLVNRFINEFAAHPSRFPNPQNLHSTLTAIYVATHPATSPSDRLLAQLAIRRRILAGECPAAAAEFLTQNPRIARDKTPTHPRRPPPDHEHRSGDRPTRHGPSVIPML